MSIPWSRQIAWYLVVAMFILGVTPRLDAAIAPSEVIASSQFDRAADLAQIQRVLELKVVKERLDKLGFTADEIRSRVGSLSDHQLHQFAQQIDDLRVGNDEALGIIIALLVIVILVIVILQLTGRKVVVTK